MNNNEKRYDDNNKNHSISTLLNGIDNAILVENTDRYIEFVNQRFCQLFNIKLPPHQLLNTSVSNNLLQFSMQFKEPFAFTNRINEIILRGKNVVNETWQLRSDKWICLNYTPVFTEHGLETHIWIYKEPEPAQNKTRNDVSSIFQKIVENIPSPIALFNTLGNFLFANKAYIPNNNLKTQSIGKTEIELYSYANQNKAVAEKRHQYLLEAVLTKLPTYWEEENKAAHFQCSVIPLLNEVNEVENVLAYHQNISIQKKLEIQLLQAGKEFQQVLNNLKEFVILTDGQLNIQFMNTAVEQLTGSINMSKENKTLFDIIGITQYDFYKKTFTSLNEGLTDIEGTIEIPQQNGEKKLLQYNLSSSFNVEGANTGIVATLNDITPQIKAEQGLLELVKKQQELNELKTAFVNMVSHELRTPLTVISSSAEILELLLDSGKTKDELTVYTKQIIDEVEKMTAFMQDLLMVSKIEAGKMELHLAETNIHQLLQEIAMEGFHPWKDGRSLTMSQRRPAKNNIVDATMIKHAVQNLLHNAFKYSTGKAAPTARISYGKRACTISIIDNGIGIIAEDISKLFTSFMRGKNTGNIPGTGIGLVVVKYFIEQHKGMVSVKSKAGAGSIFSIYLPYTNS